MAEVWSYTERLWDTEQAVRYINQLRKKITAIAENPNLGSDCSELYPDLRRIRCGSHLIYYLATDALLDVVRVLHARRDPTSLL
jgi:toxin ParE1/3/4